MQRHEIGNFGRPRKCKKVFTTRRTIKTFTCRICDADFKAFIDGEGDSDGMRAQVLKEFCAIINFKGKQVPDNCPRDSMHFCLSCEVDVWNVVKSPEARLDLQNQVFKKVKVATLPPAPETDLGPELDWLTDLTAWIIKMANAAKSDVGENENGTSVRSQSAENLVFMMRNTGLGERSNLQDDESLACEEQQQQDTEENQENVGVAIPIENDDNMLENDDGNLPDENLQLDNPAPEIDLDAAEVPANRPESPAIEPEHTEFEHSGNGKKIDYDDFNICIVC